MYHLPLLISSFLIRIYSHICISPSLLLIIFFPPHPSIYATFPTDIMLEGNISVLMKWFYNNYLLMNVDKFHLLVTNHLHDIFVNITRFRKDNQQRITQTLPVAKC